MSKSAPLLVATLIVAFLAAFCVTGAFWAGTALSSEAAAYTKGSQSSYLTKMSVAGQTDTSLDTTPRLSTSSRLYILALQSTTPSNATQARKMLTANNTTRIIVPISTAKNASSAAAQTSNGFAFPAWFWIWVPILILAIILVFLIMRLVRGGDDELPDGDTRPAATHYLPKAGESRPRQIPIEGAETEARLRDESRSSAKDQKVTKIPIDTPNESRERKKS